MKGMTTGDRIWVALYSAITVGCIAKWENATYTVVITSLAIATFILDLAEEKWRK